MHTLITYLSESNWHIYIKIGSYLLIALTFLGVAGTILLENRNPVKAMAYILLLVFVPVVGLIVYYYLGRDLRKKRRFTLKGSKDEVLFAKYWQSQRPHIEQMQVELRKKTGNKQELSAMLLNTRQSVLTKNNQVQLLINGEEKFPVVYAALRAARHHIHIEYYMIADDDVGNTIAEILIEKLQQGVQVRFLYDDMGSDRIGKIPKRLKAHGASVYPFSPVLVDFYLNANYRNHRKIIVVDGTVGFVGGINLDERYINNGKHNIYWRDTHLKIEGDAVNILQLQFLMSYRYCSKEVFPFETPYFGPSALTGTCFTDIVASGPDSEWPMAMECILMAINVAKRRIRITNPYFIPTEELLTALQMAALAGKEVQLLLPWKGDSFIVQHAALSYIKPLLAAGVKVFFYTRGFIHAKTMVIDDNLAWVSSVNFDNRSFYLNCEIAALLYDEEVAAKLNRVFEEDLLHAVPVQETRWNKRNVMNRFLDAVCRLLTPLL
ncbi:cardiolipin synthase [Chitinophaga nivalis]|uniref:Cardiolipin synthase n=1 Tax=Chitinophaga nivalis TaxID=2991709 RepID=A0ABT3IV76_9BACT|nr:cardiolipin synthase [Chitinophaga nivalis]MCW3462402.1 cardiolipin synthase [Chitinophaga nivalis]MCW3487907.1 cardiolipin synthase [Chitinophaga nivalis]